MVCRIVVGPGWGISSIVHYILEMSMTVLKQALFQAQNDEVDLAHIVLHLTVGASIGVRPTLASS